MSCWTQAHNVFVDSGFNRRVCQHLAQRGIQVQVPTGVCGKGAFQPNQTRGGQAPIIPKQVGNNYRSIKDYERKIVHTHTWLYVATIRRLAHLT